MRRAECRLVVLSIDLFSLTLSDGTVWAGARQQSDAELLCIHKTSSGLFDCTKATGCCCATRHMNYVMESRQSHVWLAQSRPIHPQTSVWTSGHNHTRTNLYLLTLTSELRQHTVHYGVRTYYDMHKHTYQTLYVYSLFLILFFYLNCLEWYSSVWWLTECSSWSFLFFRTCLRWYFLWETAGNPETILNSKRSKPS